MTGSEATCLSQSIEHLSGQRKPCRGFGIIAGRARRNLHPPPPILPPTFIVQRKTEAQREQVSCLKSHSKSLTSTRSPDLQAWSPVLHFLFRTLLAAVWLKPGHFLFPCLQLLSWKMQGFHNLKCFELQVIFTSFQTALNKLINKLFRCGLSCRHGLIQRFMTP